MEGKKRLFFGFSVNAPWPMTYPKGRMIEESSRHMTFAFLGNHPFIELEKNLSSFPKPAFLLSPVGMMDQLLFLPKSRPRVVSYHVTWFTNGDKMGDFQKAALNWLETLHFKVDRGPFLPHTTLARSPFDPQTWEEAFEILPVIVTGIHLYESVGNLRYVSLWEIPFLTPFQEIEHTADIAFVIFGKNLTELYLHGAIALSFKFPSFLKFIEKREMTTLNEVIQSLNRMISLSDLEMGCPFKAVSYHGKIKEEKQLFQWEMVIDV